MNLIFTLILMIFYHPLHVTLTHIEYDEMNNKCLITIKIFSDDFETALENHSKKDIVLNAENESNNIGEIINAYINDSFSIIFDNKRGNLKYISKSNNFEATWLNFEAEVDTFEELKVQNKLLLDIYDDQTNLLIFNKGKLEKGYNMNVKNTELTISNK